MEATRRYRCRPACTCLAKIAYLCPLLLTRQRHHGRQQMLKGIRRNADSGAGLRRRLHSAGAGIQNACRVLPVAARGHAQKQTQILRHRFTKRSARRPSIGCGQTASQRGKLWGSICHCPQSGPATASRCRPCAGRVCIAARACCEASNRERETLIRRSSYRKGRDCVQIRAVLTLYFIPLQVTFITVSRSHGPLGILHDSAVLDDLSCKQVDINR